MGLFDVHAHLTHHALASREDEVMANARAANVTTIVCNGPNPTDNEAVRALAQRQSIVKPAFGFYPVDTVLSDMRAAGVEYPHSGRECSTEEGVAWVQANVQDAFAVGEIGLDGYWVPEPFWAKQEQVFAQLVQIAIKADKPIIIHTRKREQRTFELLQELGAPRVDWHCFGGKVKLARRIVEQAGHYFSIPANARRSESFTRMLETLPRERLLLETDCPYLSPDKERQSEPADVADTARFTAELWQCSLDEVQAQMEHNFTALFGVAP